MLINACGHKLRRTKNFFFLKKDRFFGETAFVMLQTETGGWDSCVYVYAHTNIFFGKFGFEAPKRAFFIENAADSSFL